MQHKHLKINMMKKFISTLLFIFIFKIASACSIFACSHNGKVLVGSNEDGDFPYSFVRTIPSTDNSYGAIFFGTVDMQAQSGVNEHGLFFDFTFLPEGEVDSSFLKEDNESCGPSISDLVLKSKNVPQLLEKLKNNPFNILTSQLFIADANGEKAIINTQDIIHQKDGYLTATNFNVCKAKDGDYSCTRYDKIETSLAQNKDISVERFQEILNDVHVEGQTATQYSNIYDLRNGKIYMNLYHNYEETVEIDVKDQISKGYAIQRLENFFDDKNFMTLVTLKNHSDYNRLELTERFYTEGFDKGLAYYNQLKKENPEKADKLQNSLSLVPFTITSFERAKFNNTPLFFYYHPNFHHCDTYWEAPGEEIETAKSLLTYLLREDILQEDASYFEEMGYTQMILGERKEALRSYKNALEKTKGDEKWNIERLQNMIQILKGKN